MGGLFSGWPFIRRFNVFYMSRVSQRFVQTGQSHYTCDFILLSFSFTVSVSVHVFSCECNWYWCLFSFAVIFNTLCLEVAYDSMRLFYWHLHHIYDLILYLCSCVILCYLTGIFHAVVRKMSVLFIDTTISVFCIDRLLPHLHTHGTQWGFLFCFPSVFPSNVSCALQQLKIPPFWTIMFFCLFCFSLWTFAESLNSRQARSASQSDTGPEETA